MQSESEEYRQKLRELYQLRASRRNDIAYAVSCRVPKEEFEFRAKIDERYFDLLIEEAEAHVKKYGFWPVFEMEEIDYDDPILDIYRDEPNWRQKK